MKQNNGSNIPVIIIDDESGILFLHELMVEESNLSDQVYSFRKPLEGLEFIKEAVQISKRVLVLLDINMPEMTGWELLEKLNELNITDQVNVIMVTSSIQKADRLKSQNYPTVKMYLEKPIDLETCHLIKQSLL
ncbi:response regulator [Arthrospiribacter ruber]|uniref:Response regulator n=1 Tax=Arthrospiribacter ruber TaxID=2487934 RepID=A0A951MAV2_9BACT|nr:response regulator [Arthrospiribacter ruber]MBW3466809.1 response regulator [Arthrospiribacter ruber]MBW3469601.1 response regulator [Arthrospiribacter ruber]MBW3470324.1 response regulator [Arthrospiribacter ruber]